MKVSFFEILESLEKGGLSQNGFGNLVIHVFFWLNLFFLSSQ